MSTLQAPPFMSGGRINVFIMAWGCLSRVTGRRMSKMMSDLKVILAWAVAFGGAPGFELDFL